MSEIAPIKGSSLERDLNSKALLQTDLEAKKRFQEDRHIRRSLLKRIEDLERRLNILEAKERINGNQ